MSGEAYGGLPFHLLRQRSREVRESTRPIIKKKGAQHGTPSFLPMCGRVVLWLVDHVFDAIHGGGSTIRQLLNLNWWSCRGAAPRVRKAGPPLSPGSAPILS